MEPFRLIPHPTLFCEMHGPFRVLANLSINPMGIHPANDKTGEGAIRVSLRLTWSAISKISALIFSAFLVGLVGG